MENLAFAGTGTCVRTNHPLNFIPWFTASLKHKNLATLFSRTSSPFFTSFTDPLSMPVPSAFLCLVQLDCECSRSWENLGWGPRPEPGTGLPMTSSK